MSTFIILHQFKDSNSVKSKNQLLLHIDDKNVFNDNTNVTSVNNHASNNTDIYNFE